MFIINFKKSICLIITGLLCLISHFVPALPLQQEYSDQFSSDSDGLLSGSFADEGKSDTGLSDVFDMGGDMQTPGNNDLIIPDAFNSGVSDSELQNLKNTIYFEDRDKKDRDKFYSSQNKEQEKNSTLNLLDEKETGLSLLQDSVNSDPELKETVLNVLDSIKDVKESLTTNSEITYESAERETQQLIERNQAQQKQQVMLEQRGITNTISQEEYDPSMYREFFSSVLNFVLYAVAGIIFIKLIFLFVSWQRKVNKF